MSHKSAKCRKSNDLSRCLYRYPSGRRCRFPLSNDSSFFCTNHAHLQPPPEAVIDLTTELALGPEQFTSASQINQFLSKLLVLLAQDRISPRRGAVIAFVASLLLRTLPAIDREEHPKPDKNEPVEIDWGPDFPADNETPSHPGQGIGRIAACLQFAQRRAARRAADRMCYSSRSR